MPRERVKQWIEPHARGGYFVAGNEDERTSAGRSVSVEYTDNRSSVQCPNFVRGPPDTATLGMAGATWEYIRGLLGALPKPLQRLERVVILGVHGWDLFQGAAVPFYSRHSTSMKFCLMARLALLDLLAQAGVDVERVSIVLRPLVCHDLIQSRVSTFFRQLTEQDGFVKLLGESDMVLVATHSQGVPVSVMLIDALLTGKPPDAKSRKTHMDEDTSVPPGHVVLDSSRQRIGVLSMAGLHHGTSWELPYVLRVAKRYSSSNTKELFQLRDSSSPIFSEYLSAARRVLRAGVRVACIASYKDAVVDLYSASVDALQSANVLRALFVDERFAHDNVKTDLRPSLEDDVTDDDFLLALILFTLNARNMDVNTTTEGVSAVFLMSRLISVMGGESFGAHSSITSEINCYSLGVEWILRSHSNSTAFVEENMRHNARHYKSEHLSSDIAAALGPLLRQQELKSNVAQLRHLFERWEPSSPVTSALQLALVASFDRRGRKSRL